MARSATVHPMNGVGLTHLKVGKLALALAPETGGAIARFDWIDGALRVPILRGAADGLAQVLDAACFPLVPFVNRVRGGAFTFRGREVRLTPNMVGDPSPLHGQGWLAPWQMVAHRPAAAELAYRHEAGEWPWAYKARQRFSLDEAGLDVALTCRNLSDEPMPCGLGLHPYFPCTAATRIDTQVSHAWTIDEHVLPVEKVPATGRFDLQDRAACAQDLDHGFGGWNGCADIHSPDLPFDIRLSSDDARFFQLFSPPQGGLFVAEPVSHANAALNAPEEQWSELGLRVLEPGQEMRLDMRIEVSAKS